MTAAARRARSRAALQEGAGASMPATALPARGRPRSSTRKARRWGRAALLEERPPARAAASLKAVRQSVTHRHRPAAGARRCRRALAAAAADARRRAAASRSVRTPGSLPTISFPEGIRAFGASNMTRENTIHQHQPKNHQDKTRNTVNNVNVMRRKLGADFTGQHYLADVGGKHKQQAGGKYNKPVLLRCNYRF